MQIKIETIIAHLLKDPSPPLKFRQPDDGSLVVIAENGMKFKFTPEQVEQARAEAASSRISEVPTAKAVGPKDELTPIPKPKPEATSSSKTSTKTASKPPKKVS